MDNLVYAVVDDGFRQSKGMTSEGFKGAIPSVARSGYTLSSIGEDDSGSGGYESEGLQYTVDASIDGEDTRYNDYAFTPINRVLVNHVLQLADLGGKEVVLATGLPFQTYFRQGGTDVNQDVLERKMANLNIEVRPLNGKEPPRIVRQTVVAQGVAAVIDYLTDDQGNIRSDIDPEAPLAVVDVGGRTTDSVTIYGGSKVDHAASGTGEVGISNVYDHIESELKRRFSVSKIRLGLLEQVARQRRVSLRGQSHDVGDIVDAAVEEVGQKILREVKRRIADAAEMQAVVLVGGGATLMQRLVMKEYPHCHVPSEPEFANARGMLKFLRFMGD
ncbi:ParM/StbA family protein [Burkholderia vietnamiensis]|uniref:ParM/StbA family protein n=1 Tax=Burkholderia vietnamiensis TaxID=60552 RepID=UPI001B9261F8|nr:ParM/StbA family protein [Burkholderia vietnamiensis]MBR7919742.1 ParM/StbA family protein [Burkholderia vietnamiensis]MBR8205245.1 ParM/StbA family protein [Burkholderia vietnamiensis]